ncbi:uncharacterized protein SETTUDRAFT_161697 [Exserohilum turcica Et28A]|uniref:Uncharacterized protein n=1 Tax=Exserohilum turcicum (strain 28A) TaxID=671987 RepID=R0KC05_EXST2|nr:uncharacterized protein SETTUDRAFT_161697 [Exserohilum turcica Et28A]EOA85762.1 hypothetical protein SETTUDRAFT_161697 [Exserohilum turcica Et28A]
MYDGTEGVHVSLLQSADGKGKAAHMTWQLHVSEAEICMERHVAIERSGDLIVDGACRVDLQQGYMEPQLLAERVSQGDQVLAS